MRTVWESEGIAYRAETHEDDTVTVHAGETGSGFRELFGEDIVAALFVGVDNLDAEIFKRNEIIGRMAGEIEQLKIEAREMRLEIDRVNEIRRSAARGIGELAESLKAGS